MKVRIFSALTIQEAMNQVKNSLGRDAIILHTRKFRKGGIGGFFGHEMVEVMAAVDNIPPPVKPAAPKNSGLPVKSLIREKPKLSETFSAEKPPQETKPLTGRPEIKIPAALEPLTVPHIIAEKPDHLVSDDLRNEITGMKQMLEQLLTKSKTVPSNPWYDYLIKREILPAYAEQLLQGLPYSLSMLSKNPEASKKLLYERLLGYFKNTGGIQTLDFGCKKIALIGPTGVGKTTTLAKLAARFKMERGLRVAFITADTYRIAAVEQLKTYANLLDIPLEVVYSPAEMRAAISDFADRQLILIDTAGRSQYNDTQMQELKNLLAADDKIESHLVMSATTKHQDAADIVDRFAVCDAENIIFTKIDEARNIGTLFNIMYQFPGLSISYITNGQDVPDDLEPANATKLAEMLLRD